MILNVLIFILMIALAIFLGWSTLHLARSHGKWSRWIGTPLLGLLTLLVLAVAGVTARGLYILYMPVNEQTPDIIIQGTAEQIARGKEIAQSMCISCHSSNGELPLSGGNVSLGSDAGLNLGAVFPPNLTPAGPLKDVSDGAIWQIFRTGILPNGRQIIMPVGNLSHLSDKDLSAVIAYLRSQPAIENQTPTTNPNILATILIGANLFNPQIQPISSPVSAPPKGPTAEYGQYIVSYNDCTVCHGVQLDGHPSGPVKPGPNLQVVKGWTVDQFIQTFRTGIDPSGHQIQLPMPWKAIGAMDDTELTALYHYLVGFFK